MTPTKDKFESFVSNASDVQRASSDAVAVYVLMSIANDYADEIAEITDKYGLYMSCMKREYKALQTRMLAFDKEFKKMICSEEMTKMLKWYGQLQIDVNGAIEENSEMLAKLIGTIRDKVESYVRTCVEPDVI